MLLSSFLLDNNVRRYDTLDDWIGAIESGQTRLTIASTENSIYYFVENDTSQTMQRMRMVRMTTPQSLQISLQALQRNPVNVVASRLDYDAFADVSKGHGVQLLCCSIMFNRHNIRR